MLSTCNRAEIYAVGDSDAAADGLTRFFCDYHGLDPARLAEHLYCHRGVDAARHLFQRRSGPRFARRRRAADPRPGEDRLFHGKRSPLHRHRHPSTLPRAFAVGKRVRHETGLAEGAVSVSYAAIELAKKIFGDLSGLNVLILGAGEMAELTAVHLRAQRVKQITIASRTLASAESPGATARRPRRARGRSCAPRSPPPTSSSPPRARRSPCSTRATVEDAMRSRRDRPLFVIDIALPRDVETSVGDLDQVFLYHMDDLQSIVSENLARRTTELASAEAIVDQEVARFASWLQSREIVPTIVALRQRFESIRQAELRRLEPKLGGLTPEARAQRRRSDAPARREAAPHADRALEDGRRRHPRRRVRGSAAPAVRADAAQPRWQGNPEDRSSEGETPADRGEPLVPGARRR